MRGWHAYILAFACATGMAVLCYLAGFTALMRGAGAGMVAFIALVLLVPLSAAFATFGLVHWTLTRQSYPVIGWLQTGAFAVVLIGGLFGLVAADILEEVPAATLLVGMLFVGGRWATTRSPHG